MKIGDQVPHKWAITQMTLGEALQQLGRRDPTASYYANAVTAEKSALEVLRPDNDPRKLVEQADADLGGHFQGLACATAHARRFNRRSMRSARAQPMNTANVNHTCGCRPKVRW